MALTEYTCPTCGKTMPRDVAIVLSHTEQDIIDAIKAKHPQWVAEDGICKECLAHYKSQLHPK